MSNSPNEFGGTFWGSSLDDIDREVARLATICNIRILDPGIIERVLRKDDSVCGSKNPIAFDKLRNALTMHYHLRDQAVSHDRRSEDAGPDRRHRRPPARAHRHAPRRHHAGRMTGAGLSPAPHFPAFAKDHAP